MQAVYKDRKNQRIKNIFETIAESIKDIQRVMNLPQKIDDSQIVPLVEDHRRTHYKFMVKHDPNLIALYIIIRHLASIYHQTYSSYVNNGIINLQGIYQSSVAMTERLDVKFFGVVQTDTIARVRLFETFRAYNLQFLYPTPR